MKMSTKGRYSLTTMMYLAENYESKRYISIKEISENKGISFKYLEKIVTILNKNDFLEVQRGNNGGYRLKYKPEDYKIGDILRISEGDFTIVSCLGDDKCPKKDNCDTYPFWKGLYDQINNYMDGKTLKDLIKGEEK